jgi:hypothetical protein
MAIYVSFVTAPYAAPGTEMAMLLLYNGLKLPTRPNWFRRQQQQPYNPLYSRD